MSNPHEALERRETPISLDNHVRWALEKILERGQASFPGVILVNRAKWALRKSEEGNFRQATKLITEEAERWQNFWCIDKNYWFGQGDYGAAAYSPFKDGALFFTKLADLLNARLLREKAALGKATKQDLHKAWFQKETRNRFWEQEFFYGVVEKSWFETLYELEALRENIK